MTKEQNREALRAVVRGFKDLQKLRIQTGQRLVANYRVKHGQEPGTPEESTMDTEGKKQLEIIRLAYVRMTDGVTRALSARQFENRKETGVIDNFAEFELVAMYEGLLTREEESKKYMDKMLQDYPIYTDFLKGVKGIGVTISAYLIATIDIHKAKYPSSIWRYAGLDVGSDGRGRSRRKEHLVEREYKASDGTVKTKKSITFNPDLKTMLIGIAGPCLLKQGKKYKQIYDDYKHRLEHRPDLAEESKARRHNMAVRYMIKMFVIDLYDAWKDLEGLPKHAPYHEAKLGLTHGRDAA